MLSYLLCGPPSKQVRLFVDCVFAPTNTRRLRAPTNPFPPFFANASAATASAVAASVHFCFSSFSSGVFWAQVVFIPAHRISNLDERDTAATTEILREEMKKGSQSIISYDNCNGMLEKMREDAFM